jgi:hypothetical protein
MTDNDDQAQSSGNRWEPSADATPETGAAEPTPATETAAAAPPSRPTWVTRARAGVAGGAAAVLLAGGLGGFAIGRATAADGDGGRTTQGVPTGLDRDRDRPEGGGPGGPQLGQMPDSGQVPVRPGQEDGRQTDDGTERSTT